MVVLINRDTASAAEILASALGDHRRATIVGTRSFGKGVFQELIHLAAGGALDLTVGQYFTPKGVSLAGTGIKPAVRAADDPDTPQDEGLRPRWQSWQSGSPSRTGEPSTWRDAGEEGGDLRAPRPFHRR